MCGQPQLFEVVFALSSAGSLPRLLDGRQEQRNENRDNRDDDEEFNQSKSAKGSAVCMGHEGESFGDGLVIGAIDD
jgi:hypothetical protein